MSLFLEFFYELVMAILYTIVSFFKEFFGSFWNAIAAFGIYFNIVTHYFKDFGAIGWILGILSILAIVAVFGLLFYFIYRLLRRYFVFRRKAVEEEELMKEISRLNMEVVTLLDEKNKIMAMKVSQLGLKPGEEMEDDAGESAESASQGTSSRFVKLIAVDKKYELEPLVITDPQDFTLSDLVDRYRNFAASKMGLYYERSLIMNFVAGLGASRMIILEGISGTGKTSLPYSWGKFLKRDSCICAVQPSWRDRSELIGYLNEFTKRFNETDFLKGLYEFTFREDIGFMVLDEMNLARVEYYFAEVLSVLEMHDKREWKVDVVPDTWDNDPVHLFEGKCAIPDNVWFVGTANNDDSTFSITDKVYDRAVTIQINTKATAYEAEDGEPLQVSAAYLNGLFAKAKEEHPVSAEMLEKLDALDYYVIENFRLAFGNRIMRQITDFIPVYVACGGTETDGLDYMLTTKIFRKFEGLNITFMADNLKKLVNHLEKVFGKNKMPLAKEYLERLSKMG